MTAPSDDGLRREAARIAFALLRLDRPAAHPLGSSTPPGASQVGVESYVFLPSWRHVPHDEVETFLVGLPSPALLAPTTIRGTVALLLLHELDGDRRRWADKTLSNFANGLDDWALQLGLSPASRILLEFDAESHVVSFAGVREWTQQFAVQVGWSIDPLDDDDRADACLVVRRSDGQMFPGRSCTACPGRQRSGPDSSAT